HYKKGGSMSEIDYSEYGIEIEKDYEERENFDPRKTPYHIEKNIQDSVDCIIKKCPDADWNENLITYKIIETIRNILSNYKVPGISSDFSESAFNLEAYKLSGNAEKFHGDIAFIITRRFTSHSEPTSGVAFYEAKASSNDSYNKKEYPSFCQYQLRRLVTHTPKLNYLIYNKESCRVGSDSWPMIHNYNDDRFRQDGQYVNAAVIDANFLKSNRDISFSLRSVGLPFGNHFVRRILSGRDLDYSRSVDKTIKRWLKYTRKSSPIIVSVSIQNGESDILGTQLELPGFEKVQLDKHIYALEKNT
ncbi:hypothetical protein ACI1I1_004366, partial [Vibrio vulnificus]